MSASRFHFWDYKDECASKDLCNYADVIRGRHQHWAYFTVAAVVLAAGVALHIWRGRTNSARTRPTSLFLLLSPGLMWGLYVPVGFATMFFGEHLMAAAALTLLVGAVWLASESLGRVRGARLDLAVCYTAVALGAAATCLVWRFWPQRTAGLDAPQAALLLGAGVVTVTLLAYKGLSWLSVPLRHSAKGSLEKRGGGPLKFLGGQPG